MTYIKHQAQHVPIQLLWTLSTRGICGPCRIGAGLHFGKTRGPLDDRYIIGLLLQQRKHLFLAGKPPCCPKILEAVSMHWHDGGSCARRSVCQRQYLNGMVYSLIEHGLSLFLTAKL